MKRQQELYGFLQLLTAIVLIAIYMFPVYWIYVSGFKSNTEINQWPPTFWPTDVVFNHVKVLTDTRFWSYLSNSAIIAAGVTAVTLTLGSGCAWVLARHRSRWVDAALFTILILQTLPPSLMATPMFVIFINVGLENTQIGVILAVAAKTIPFFIIVVRASFLAIPKEIEDAAIVDGCSRAGAFVRIVLPLARNGILVAGTLIFMQSFGEYVYAKSLLQKESLQTATVGLGQYLGAFGSDWTGAMAFSSLYVTPILLVFVMLQRRIVEGLTAGSVK